MLAFSGYVAQVDVALCTGCGTCGETCQFEAIAVDNGYACVDVAACMGCGVCVALCPQEGHWARPRARQGNPSGDPRINGQGHK